MTKPQTKLISLPAGSPTSIRDVAAVVMGRSKNGCTTW